jgi:hypothetical protein
VRVALLKTRGVQKADISLDKAVADIGLSAGNAITVPQLRALMKKNGYPTRDARITAKGRLSLRDGQIMLDLLNGTTIAVEADPKAAAQIDAAARDPLHPIVDVTGVSKTAGKASEAVTLISVGRSSQ